MIFPEDLETCSNCGDVMTKVMTAIMPKNWRMKLRLRKPVYASKYDCTCGHRLTVMRDLRR